jgi:hypothetical protein
MTMTARAGRHAEDDDGDRSVRVALDWRVPAAGLWVGSFEGFFGGTIDRDGDHFIVRDTFASYLGDFPSITFAKEALEVHVMMLDLFRRRKGSGL